MSKYTRKKKLRAEDEFVDFWTNLAHKIEPYAQGIAIACVTAILITIGVWAIAHHLDVRSQVATESFGRVVKTYRAPLSTDATAPKDDDLNPVTRYATDKERAEATLTEIDNFEKKYSGSDLRRNADLFRAAALYDLGRYDEAAAAFDKAAGRVRLPVLVDVAREGSGLSHEAHGQLDTALATYQKLGQTAGKFYRDWALFDAARVYMAKGDKSKAASTYHSILDQSPQSPLRDEIQTRLAQLGVK